MVLGRTQRAHDMAGTRYPGCQQMAKNIKPYKSDLAIEPAERTLAFPFPTH